MNADLDELVRNIFGSRDAKPEDDLEQEKTKEPALWAGVGQPAADGNGFDEAFWPGYARIAIGKDMPRFKLGEGVDRAACKHSHNCPMCGGSCGNFFVLLTAFAIFGADGSLKYWRPFPLPVPLQPGDHFDLPLKAL